MNLYTEVLNALKIVNDPWRFLDRMLKHEDLVKIKRLRWPTHTKVSVDESKPARFSFTTTNLRVWPRSQCADGALENSCIPVNHLRSMYQ